MRLARLPPRPYKNVLDFWDSYRGTYKGPKESLYPCPMCYGSGKVKKFEDRDPVEGYKLAPTYPCDVCAGSGKRPAREIEQVYKTMMAEWRRNCQKAREFRDLQIAALFKAKQVLTKEELKALGLWRAERNE